MTDCHWRMALFCASGRFDSDQFFIAQAGEEMRLGHVVFVLKKLRDDIQERPARVGKRVFGQGLVALCLRTPMPCARFALPSDMYAAGSCASMV